jgi:drug/metabolite transporter (DMT)-like permease
MGVLIPGILMVAGYLLNMPPDDILFISWKWPAGIEWVYILWLGLAALFGQYFVTLAYGADKAGVVSAIGYANIIFSVFLGMALGDAFPDWMSVSGMLCIIGSGVLISLFKGRPASS